MHGKTSRRASRKAQLVEYGLILALISVVAIALWQNLGNVNLGHNTVSNGATSNHN